MGLSSPVSYTMVAQPSGRGRMGPGTMTIKRVWIEEGCISCNLCEDLCPEVFEVPAGSECRTTKHYKKHLNGDAEMIEKIQEAAESCPVEVIQVEEE